MVQICKTGSLPGLRDVLAPDLFKALCDPTRLAILVRLAECCNELSVSQVAECCPVNISVVSRHLACLRDAGLLRSVKRGKEVFYSFQAEPMARSLRAIADAAEKCCPEHRKKSDEQAG